MHVHVQPPVKWKDSCLMVIGVLLKQELENLHTWREREQGREGGREREGGPGGRTPRSLLPGASVKY